MEINKEMAREKLIQSVARHTGIARAELLAAATAAEAAGEYALQLQLYGAYNSIAAALPRVYKEVC